MVSMLGGLITYLLPAIYCNKTRGEKVSIESVRELRIKISNEAAIMDSDDKIDYDVTGGLYATV